jgi:hypothetical protein
LEDVEVLTSLEILDLGILLVEFFRDGRKELKRKTCAAANPCNTPVLLA